MTSETGEPMASRSAAVWARLAAVLEERDCPVDTLLVRLAALWRAATDGCSVCVVCCPRGATAGRFVVCTGEAAEDTSDAGSFSVPESARWIEVASRHLPGGFGEYEVVRFRAADHTTAGGVLVGSDDAIGDDDFVHTLRLLSARVLLDAVESDPGRTVDERTTGELDQMALDPERLESMAEFSAGAGHEINNPLGTIIGRVQLLLREETDVDRRQSLATIGGQAYRVRDMIGDAMLFARPPTPEPEWNLLSGVVDEVLMGLEDDLAAGGFEVDVEFPRAARVYADPVQLRVALGAVLRNAVEAKSEQLAPQMTLRLEEGSEDAAEIIVSDNGIGLTREQRRYLFDPFYSGRQAGRGLGFGLSKCWRIVSNHGGSVRVETESGWTTFRLTFPNPAD